MMIIFNDALIAQFNFAFILFRFALFCSSDKQSDSASAQFRFDTMDENASGKLLKRTVIFVREYHN